MRQFFFVCVSNFEVAGCIPAHLFSILYSREPKLVLSGERWDRLRLVAFILNDARNQFSPFVRR